MPLSGKRIQGCIVSRIKERKAGTWMCRLRTWMETMEGFCGLLFVAGTRKIKEGIAAGLTGWQVLLLSLMMYAQALLLWVDFFHMQFYIRLISHFLITSLCTFVLASLMHSQFVLYELSEIGVTIEWSVRLSSSLDDLLGLASGYGPMITIALFIAFSVMALIRRKSPITTSWLYPLAGLLAMMTLLLAMHPILNITLIAGARSPLGFAAQCLSGLAGGWIFMHLRNSIITNKRQLKVAVKRS